MRQKHCRLCQALMDGLEDGEIRPCNTVLLKTPRFVVVPAIGPLVCGHALVVSRDHYNCLASMPEEGIAEYERIAKVLSLLPQIRGNLLEAEHGPTGECNAGACVAHTHVHLLPSLGGHHDFLQGRFSVLRRVNTLTDICGMTDPYIMVRGIRDEAVFYDAESAPSQAIRRVLCERLGDPAWDWRLAPRYQEIEATVRFWEDALQHAEIA